MVKGHSCQTWIELLTASNAAILMYTSSIMERVRTEAQA